MAPPTEAVDRTRSISVDPFRVDIVRRAGTARILPDTTLARSVAQALEAAGAPRPADVTVVLTDDAELAELNAEHLGRDGPTDVLSFPMLPPASFPRHPGQPPRARPGVGADAAAAFPGAPFPGAVTHVGDIAISLERAQEQADAGRGGQTGDVRWSAAKEVRLLVTHGTLHLCGWDHAEPAEEAAMRALEQQLLS